MSSNTKGNGLSIVDEFRELASRHGLYNAARYLPVDWDAFEHRITEVAQESNRLGVELALARAEVSAFRLLRKIDMALFDARAIDIETAESLVRGRLEANPERTPKGIVLELVREKPFLFHGGPARAAKGASKGGTP